MTKPIYLVELAVTPAPNAASGNGASGAYANVYVRAADSRSATERAVRELESSGWLVHQITEVNERTPEFYEHGSDGLKYYEQCEVDGIVIVLHTWRDEH
jgi:hypothetical protein